MTDLQIYLLVAPFVLLALGGVLAAYARHDAARLTNRTTPGNTPAE